MPHQELAQEVQAFLAAEVLHIWVDKLDPRLPLVAAKKVLVVRIQRHPVLLDVREQIVGTQDLSVVTRRTLAPEIHVKLTVSANDFKNHLARFPVVSGSRPTWLDQGERTQLTTQNKIRKPRTFAILTS